MILLFPFILRSGGRDKNEDDKNVNEAKSNNLFIFIE